MTLLDYVQKRMYYLSATRENETVVVTEHGFLGRAFYNESDIALFREKVQDKLDRRPEAMKVTYYPFTRVTEVDNSGGRHIPFIHRR